jgi:hypothetical protein
MFRKHACTSALAVVLVAAVILLAGCSIDDILGNKKRGELKGTVYDGASGSTARLTGATIVVSGRQTTSDVSGQYALTDLPVGDQQLTATKPGYVTYTGTVRIREVGTDDPLANRYSFTMQYNE